MQQLKFTDRSTVFFTIRGCPSSLIMLYGTSLVSVYSICKSINTAATSCPSYAKKNQ